MLKKLKVRHHEDGRTLLDFLAANMKMSRGKTKDLIDSRNVFVNRRRIWMARHELAPDDIVEITVPDEIKPVRAKTGIKILFQDADYVIADKPAGVLSDGENSMETMLRTQLNAPALAAAHRLDRYTSGCLLLAMNRNALAGIIPLFKKFEVFKLYNAIVAGRLTFAERTVSTPIDGHPAVTHVRTISAADRASHAMVKIDTGRTHQIRVHMNAMRHPVLGDKQYGLGPATDEFTMQIPRQMLHAGNLEFTHPVTKQRIKARSPLPEDFRKCLKSLGLR